MANESKNRQKERRQTQKLLRRNKSEKTEKSGRKYLQNVCLKYHKCPKSVRMSMGPVRWLRGKGTGADQCKTDDLSWVPESHAEVESENRLHRVDSDLHV